MKIFLSMSLALFLIAGAPQAKASFGCEVLLCLAASNGTPAECKPILKKLFKRLSRGKSFPVCKMESGPDTGGNDSGDNASGGGLPKAERGVAVFVPRHKICLDWGHRTNGRGDQLGRVCRNERVIEAHYDHSGKTCHQWFPPTDTRATDDTNRSIRRMCRAKSKKWVKVQGEGIEGEYHYY